MDSNSEEPQEPIPDLRIAQQKFILSLPENMKEKKKKSQFLDTLYESQMAPYYEQTCKELNISIDKKKLTEMQSLNRNQLQELDSEIEFAQENLGASEQKEALLRKANFLVNIGDKEQALNTLKQAYEKTICTTGKMENCLLQARLGLFFNDLELAKINLDRTEELLELEADWHCKNCFKLHLGLYCLATRNFSKASELFLNSISSFSCTELMDFEEFIKYTVLSSLLVLPRSELKSKLINNPEVNQVLHLNEPLKNYVDSLYNCDYLTFFQELAQVEITMKQDMFLNPHYRYYIREMKAKAYDQLLSTYSSVKLSYMAQLFGVSIDFLENDLGKMIANGRLGYKIDGINKDVVNLPKDPKTESFKELLRHGDLLLNRVQKLSRVINI